MRNNFLKSYLCGITNACEVLLEYPFVAMVVEKLPHSEKKQRDYYTVVGFVLLGLILGSITALFATVSAWLFGKVAGGFFGTLIAFFLLEFKDKGAGIMLITSFLGNKFVSEEYGQNRPVMSKNIMELATGIDVAIFTLLIIIKFACYFILIYNSRTSLFVALFIINYFTQAFLVSNKAINSNVLFRMELHDLDKFYLLSLVILLVGIHFGFIAWFMTILVFSVLILLINRLRLISGIDENLVAMFGAVAEFSLAILLTLSVL